MTQKTPQVMIIAERGYCRSDEHWQQTIEEILSIIKAFPSTALQVRNKHCQTSWRYIKAHVQTWIATHPTQCLLNGDTFPEIQCRRHFPETLISPIHKQPTVIGASIHSQSALKRAVDAGVHYVQYGAIYPTSKPVEPLGLRALSLICSTSPVPVLAVGGINSRHRVRSCLENGAYGVSVGSWMSDNVYCELAEPLREMP